MSQVTCCDPWPFLDVLGEGLERSQAYASLGPWEAWIFANGLSVMNLGDQPPSPYDERCPKPSFARLLLARRKLVKENYGAAT